MKLRFCHILNRQMRTLRILLKFVVVGKSVITLLTAKEIAIDPKRRLANCIAFFRQQVLIAGRIESAIPCETDR